MNWNFAPCLAMPEDERWGRYYEGYSENPELVSELGVAAIEGYQNKLGKKHSIAVVQNISLEMVQLFGVQVIIII